MRTICLTLLLLAAILLLSVGVFKNFKGDYYQDGKEKAPTLVDSQVSPNGLYRSDLYRGTYEDKDCYYEFFVTDLKSGTRRKAVSGTPRTSDISWTKDNRIEVTYNCGTGCRATKIINVGDYIAVSDYKEGRMNEENGWNVQFLTPP